MVGFCKLYGLLGFPGILNPNLCGDSSVVRGIYASYQLWFIVQHNYGLNVGPFGTRNFNLL